MSNVGWTLEYSSTSFINVFRCNFSGSENGSACVTPTSSSDVNSTTAADAAVISAAAQLALKVIVSVLLTALIVGTVVGNACVILSVAAFDKMRTLSNGLIASLASADLLVAIVVLPLSLQYEMVGEWTLGPYICDLWITSDVFCCTASILNIVVIALDRYWLITRNVRYTHSTVLPRRTVCSVLLTAAWLVSALIASSPLMGWRTGTERDDPSACLISQDYGYTVFSTFGAFWFPLGVILVVYARIFVFARRRASRRRTVRTGNGFKPSPQQQPAVKVMSAVVTGGGRRSAVALGGGSGGGGVAFPGDTSICAGGTSPSGFDELQLPTIAFADRSDSLTPQESTGRTAVDGPSNCVTGCDMTDNTGMTTVTADVTSVARNRKSRRRAMRMRRSARTLGLIIGGFLVCWLPFFVVATTVPFCPSCDVPPTVASVVLWLGYSNSLLNPAIYAIWDQSFRRSFHRIVTCNTVKY